ncbi:MAG: DUF58 domain-containing protein [Anaerolineales bacterium]|nr:DUF58 domain-containing protein [Anaerolineales bacterium]
MKITELRLRYKIIPYLLPILFINQLVSPRKVWMILLVGLATVLFISYSWAVTLKNNLNLIREMRFGWSKVGDHLQERFNLDNSGWAPATWIYLEDHSDLAGYNGSRVTRIGGNAHRQWFEKGFCERRGLFTIGPTSVHTGDPLGIFEVRIEYPATSNMMVMPPIFNLPDIQIAPGGKVGEGINTTKSWNHTVTASGVREYNPGDSLRYIHWPTSARRDELFVRTFDSTPTSDQWIFLDMFGDSHTGEGEDASEEHAIILAASLMNWALENGRAVGIGVNGKELSWYQPRMDETQKWIILRALALLEKGEDPLHKLLEAARQSLRFRSSVIVITADLSGNWLNPILLMRKKGIVPTILLLNAPAFGGKGDIRDIQKKLDSVGLGNYLIGPEYLDNMEKELSPATQKRREEFKEARKVHWRPLI